jgi:hypothetical protein
MFMQVANKGRNKPTRSQLRAHLSLIASRKRPNSRIRLAVRRCFILSGGCPVTIGQVLERSYPRLRRFTSWHYLAARRALRLEAVVIARHRYGRGRPNLWVPRDTQWLFSPVKSLLPVD